MKISKIVITGGPCAGKTTAMSWIQNAFSKRGYTVLFIPETATELIGGGVAPWTCGTNLDFQHLQMFMQLTKEKVFEQAAKTMSAEKILIVCDRGTIDNKAYMSDEEYAAVLSKLGMSEVELRDSYDAVFHLVTAAKGALEAYTLSNNKARTETPQQAAELDDRMIAAWTGHPHLRVIDNSGDFENKLQRTIKEITAFLGEPEPYEIERKYLIKYPDVGYLESLPNCKRVEISQSYLRSDGEKEVRIRQRGISGGYTYYKTEKFYISDLKRIEIEQRLTQDEYLELLMNVDPDYRQIRKSRYCLTHNNRYFEIDLYPFWNDKAILEVELSSENEEIQLPDFLEVIREVTNEKEYKNRELAKL